MKPYDEFEIEDFATNDTFIEWSLNATPESNSFWNQWMQRHPEKKATILAARQLIIDLKSMEDVPHSPSIEDEIWDGIVINEETKHLTTKSGKGMNLILAVAATVAMVLSVWFLIQEDQAITEVSLAQSKWINTYNNSGSQKTIELEDGSTVILEPFGSLKYPLDFNLDQREVFLKGEAYFDIARDTTKPFLVYANETITKVLGTSFIIKAFEGEETVEVEVKTGKVAVYAKVADKEEQQSPQILIQADEKILIPRPNKKIDITPNHKVVFNRIAENMIKELAEVPELVQPIEKIAQQKFDNESVVQVFEALASAYGVTIDFDKKDLQNCTITTVLRGEPLYQKLEIICSALDLEYTSESAQIIISGRGCN